MKLLLDDKATRGYDLNAKISKKKSSKRKNHSDSTFNLLKK